MNLLRWSVLAGGLLLLAWFLGADSPPARPPFAADAGCLIQGDGQALAWRHFHDGDTLQLADGRNVRVLGLNAPEMSGQRGREPLAGEATRAAREFLAGEAVVLVQPGPDPVDRYGRTLAHLFRAGDGSSLAQHLLSRGLAWQVAVPPNLAYLECLLAAEDSARRAGVGVWSADYSSESGVAQPGPGFRVLRTRIESISFGGSWWLQTEDDFVIRVASADQPWFDRQEVARWRGAVVEVRGWMFDRRGSAATSRGYAPWVLTLRHPSGLRQLAEH